MKHLSFLTLTGLIIAFAGSPADALSQSPVSRYEVPDIDKMPPCDLVEAQAPRVACYDNVKQKTVPVDNRERSFRLRITETGDAELLFEELAQNSQREYRCEQPKNPSPEDVAALKKCMDDFPNCDKKKWEESEDGGLIFICKCRCLFSSC
ncbi:MAG: hypothetical protein F4246_09595 [Rhodothermaceae bacterium]|nr:hypothetical protein [Rhodothermaceae bacterium]MYD19032.1 hypothetical protein [Rhodothermaceae bacterium]MYD57254.1 hypothetical protein [Rhodothermaceae bacterium]MYI42617.1 hypothetical protein [Rhodothermaceae bacterium]MYJ56781.1 hypothetical protein [Rhodothermaceae bacterium]